MSTTPWQERFISGDGLELASYVAGRGPSVVFIHGGPGDDHRYMRQAAAPLLNQFRCVLYDQRGSGRSRLGRLTPDTLQVDRFLADLEALRADLGGAPLRLVGHSWGANLALLYAAAHPQSVETAALIAMGPLDDANAAVARANLRKPLTQAEREEVDRLRDARQTAAADADWDLYRQLHIETVALYSRGWFYSHAAREAFLDEYEKTYAFVPLVNRYAVASARAIDAWQAARRVTASLLVLYGHQDFEPISQAFQLRRNAPKTEVRLLNECGHVPWLEHPALFSQILRDFLSR